jgi:DNA-binding response OmpR family regulator
MRPFVLVGSSSPYRESRYALILERHEFDVCVVQSGVECIKVLWKRLPSVMLLECSLLWGGAEGVLEIRSEDPVMNRIPVVLLSNDGVTADDYHLARFRIAGYFGRIPSGYELVAVIENALQSKDEAEVADSAHDKAAFN